MALSRRQALFGATALAGVTLGDAGLLDWATAWAADQPFTPEKGAKLKLLRWRPFVQSERDGFKRMADAFTATTGVPVEIATATNLQVSIKAAMAARMGGGPDLVWS